MALIISTWQWGRKYGPEYVHRLAQGVWNNLGGEFRFLVIHPSTEDEPLTRIPGCFARLRAFDPEWQQRNGIRKGDRLVCLDLDLVITGRLDELFDRPEPFVIWQGANAANPCPFNGSVWMTTAGYRPDVWTDFSLEAARSIPAYEFPDDQGWFWHKMPDAAGWKCGESGIWAFRKRGWPKDDKLPENARIVAFPGARDPSEYHHLDWVRKHWLLS